MTGVVIFCLTYLGIAMGKIPGYTIDRVGIALLGAIAMVACGEISAEDAVRTIDLPTILLLYSLMIVSAQLRLGGFYTWCACRMVKLLHRPRLFLFVSMITSALLSAVLANDIVCFAFTPVLTVSLLETGLNPLPFLIGLAVSSNIGSAATIIGNPQNMLIGQVGGLDFSQFVLWCGPPAIVALLGGYLVISFMFRNVIHLPEGNRREPAPVRQWPDLDRWQTAKGLVSVAILLALFLTGIPREISALAIAGALLCSRKMKTRDILGLVDWHLITLFCALFIINGTLVQSGYLGRLVEILAGGGLVLQDPLQLATIITVLSNLVSNVPAVMMVVGFLDSAQPVQWYTLALSSTFAGNLFLLGSLANIIVVEQAAGLGVRISFKQHALTGIPVTLISLLVLVVWIVV